MVSDVTKAGQAGFDKVVPPDCDLKAARARKMKWLVAFCYCACCAIWGTTYFAIRIACAPQVGCSTYFVGAVRFFMGALPFLIVWLIFRRKLKAPSRQELGWLAVAGCFNGLYQITTFGSEQHISGGLAAVISATSPLMVALIAVLTRTEQVSGRTVAGFCICLFGIGLVCHDRLQVSTAQAWATLLMLTSSFFNACSNVTLKRRCTELNPIVAACIFNTVTTGPMWIYSLAQGEPQFTPIPAAPLGAIIYLAVTSSVVAFGLYLYMLRHMSLMAASTIPFVIPVLALVVDLFLEKHFALTMETSVGIVVVLVGVVYSIMRR